MLGARTYNIFNRNKQKFMLLLFSLLTVLISTQELKGQCWQQTLRPQIIEGKYGGVNIETGKLVIPAKFGYARRFVDNYLLVTDSILSAGRYYGVSNEQGNLVLPMKYNDIQKPACDYYLATQGSRITLFDQNFKTLYITEADYFSVYPKLNRFTSLKRINDTLNELVLLNLKSNEIYTRKSGSRIDLISNYIGKERKYAGYLPFFTFVKANKRISPFPQIEILDLNGKVLFDSIQFIEVQDYRVTMQRNGIYIITDTSFKVNDALSYKYDNYRPLYDPMHHWYSVSKKGKKGVVDKNGEILFPVIHDNHFIYIGKNTFALKDLNYWNGIRKIYFTSGRILDLKNNLFANYSNPLITNSPFNWPVVLTGDYGKYGLMDSLGNFIVQQEYDKLAYNHDQLIYFKNGKSGFMNREGKVLLTAGYDGLAPYKNGFAIAAKIKRIYPLPFSRRSDNFYYFQEKPTDTLYTFLDHKGKRFGFYDKVTIFKDSMAQVVKDGKQYVINRKGRKIFFGAKKKYWLYSHFKENIGIITNGKQTKFGFVNREGVIIENPKYSNISIQEDYTDLPYSYVLEFENEIGFISIIKFPEISDGKIYVVDPSSQNSPDYSLISIKE